MSDPNHPTNPDWVLFDPEIVPPPPGELLVITPGGRCIPSPWFEGCLAWGYKPKIPQSVKDRQKLLQLNRKGTSGN